MKLFRTASPVVVKCCQLAFNNFLPVQVQVDICTAKFLLQKLIASENSFCYLFS